MLPKSYALKMKDKNNINPGGKKEPSFNSLDYN